MKKIITALLTLGLTSFTVCAMANDLSIKNNTDFNATSRINDGLCSNTLGDPYGTTYAHSSNTVPDNIIQFACTMNDGDPSNCKAEIYMTNDCNDSDPNAKPIGVVMFDINNGITSISMNPGTHFTVSGSGFDITLAGTEK